MSVSSPVERILIVRPSALGDVCRTVPALVSLRRAYPNARIDWVVRDQFREAIEAHPDLDEVIPFPRARFARWWKPTVLNDLRRWLHDLRTRQYDLVFDLQGLGRSGLIAWATRSPRRIGFRTAREFASLGYTVRHDGPRAIHIVDQMIELLESEGITPVREMQLYAPPAAVESWERRQRELGIESPFVVLAPTSRWPGKQWPAEHWIATLPELRARGFREAVIIGAPGEESQVEPIVSAAQNDLRLHNLVGRTSIGETMAVIAGAALVIASDSAPLHMAVGFKRPLVALFGPTDPAFVGPYGCDEFVAQHPDASRAPRSQFKNESVGRRLMRLISVGQVMEIADRALGERPEAATGIRTSETHREVG